MAQQDVLDNGQTQPGATGRGNPAGVRTIEALGQPGQVVGLNAGAVVTDLQQTAAVLAGTPLQPDPAVITSVIDDVGQQIANGTAQLVNITQHRQSQRYLKFN